MRIRMRKTVRRVMLLLVAFSTFVAGLSVFYFYAEAAGFLFKPNQPTPETTKTLSTRLAPPPVFPPPFTFSTPEYQAAQAQQQVVCERCIRDKEFGLVEYLDGEYANYVYLYSTTIPEEVEAMRAAPPAPNHGFVARILNDPNALIYVDGSYDAALFNSTPEAANLELDSLIEESPGGIVILERKSTRLGTRAATSYTAQYTDSSTGITMIEEAVVALRKDSPGEDTIGIIYSVKLRTPIYNQKKNRAAFEKILRSWREIEMGDD